MQWLSLYGDSHVDETLVNGQVIACLQTLDEGKDVPTAVHTFCDAIIILQSQFTVFKSEMRRKFQLFAFWMNMCALCNCFSSLSKQRGPEI